MENEQSLNKLKVISKTLINFEVNRVFNSIGTNIFIEFGKDIEYVSTPTKKWLMKEWCIGINDASWRLSKDEKYLVGAADDPQKIQLGIDQLIGKRFLSFNVLSQFLDMEFNFEGGYQLTTFFNLAEERQWEIFLPDQTEIFVDCSSSEALKKVQTLSENLPIKTSYKKIDFAWKELKVTEIYYLDDYLNTIFFENNICIQFLGVWRLEKNNEYLYGWGDELFKKTKVHLSQLIGKKLKSIEVANSMMDARFIFEDGYVLKTFCCYTQDEQWAIYFNKRNYFSAQIPLLK